MLSYPILTVYVYEYFFNHSSLHFLSPPSHCRALSTLSHMYSLNPSFSLYSLFPPSLKCTLSTPLITVLSLILSHCTPWPPLALYSLSPSPPLSLYSLSPLSHCTLSHPLSPVLSLSPSLSVPSPPLSHCTFCLRFWYVCWQSVNRNPSKPNQTFFDRSRRILVIAEKHIQGRTFEMFTIQ